MIVKFLKLAISKRSEIKENLKLFKKFLLRGSFVLGKDVEKLEKKISIYINKKYTLGVSSGTNALYLALKSINIKKDDEVIVPSLSWYSTFTAVTMTGAKPVGIDINDDFLINTSEIQKRITSKTKALIIVHFTGLIKNMDIIRKICKINKIFLIEDCAQAFGAIYNGKKAGYFGDVSAFSMNPMKVLSSFGESGAVSSSNKKIYEKLKILRYAGVDIKKDECFYPDLNHKIDTLQSLVILKKIKSLKGIIKKRIANAAYYNKYIDSKIKKPEFYKNFQHIYYTYQIRCSKRDNLLEFLKKKGIETKIQHKKLLCDHIGFKNLTKDTFHNARKIVKQSICIPIHEKLTKKELFYIVKNVNYFAKKYL
jgi:dTDP-4-amino-4,6-dideoxygalactose transaminase